MPFILYRDLGYNTLTGFIPKEISTLQSLTALHFSRNLMQGPVPQEIANLASLNELCVTHLPLPLPHFKDSTLTTTTQP